MTPWPWWAAGGALGLYFVLFAWLASKPVGVSSGIGSMCGVCGVGYYRKKPFTDSWRLWFVLGIPLGGLAGAAIAGKVGIVTAMGVFDTAISSSLVVKLGFLFGGGALAGFGSRWADG